MSHLDGNALAGVLSEIFEFDATLATGRCRGCGDESVLARAMVYADAPGFVVRCSHCGDVLVVLVRDGDRTWMNLRGLDALRFIA